MKSVVMIGIAIDDFFNNVEENGEIFCMCCCCCFNLPCFIHMIKLYFILDFVKLSVECPLYESITLFSNYIYAIYPFVSD